MEADFWHQRWDENRISFHQGKPNALLSSHFHHLGLTSGDRILVPLCGKAVDLDWLALQGLQVVGVELHQPAVHEVFERMGVKPAREEHGDLKSYLTDTTRIFVGDLFKLTADMLGPVDAIYDRAALVAMPDNMRPAYAAHLMAITQNAPQLVISYDYDQSQMEGPPFAVSGEEIGRLYGSHYGVDVLASEDITGTLAERCKGKEEIRLLSRLQRTNA